MTLDDTKITIQCDNAQTIRLINSDVALLQTKLRHVDIHNHWLRQEALANRILVQYTPTTDMIADGLTKALPAQQFEKFVMQVGLVDIERIRERRLKELTVEDFIKAEDEPDGGEAKWTDQKEGQPDDGAMDCTDCAILPSLGGCVEQKAYAGVSRAGQGS